MKKLTLMILLSVAFGGLHSADAQIYVSLSPSPMYVGQSWTGVVAWVPDEYTICNPYQCLYGTYTVATGDFGTVVGEGVVNCQPCTTPCYSGASGGLFPGAITYNSVGTRTITIKLYSCIPPNAENIPFQFPANVLLASWSGTMVVLPQPIQPPTPSNPTPCTANKPVLIDPVAANLVTGGQIAADNDQLAGASAAVQGAAADGVTELLLQIPASNVGDGFGVQVLNENNQTDQVTNVGGLFPIGGVPDDPVDTLDVVAVDTSQGPMAFAAYVAPTNFCRGTQDASNVQRTITFQVACSGSNGTQVATTTSFLMRPPVLLVHGLWSNPSDTWKAFSPLNETNLDMWNILQQERADYSEAVYGVTGTSPSYVSPPSTYYANALGFAYNAPTVMGQIQKLLGDYENNQKAAAVQVDVIAHSMGGDIVRTIPTLAGFFCGDASCPGPIGANYNAGPIHKLITIGTPHQGTPLANDLLPGGLGDPNACVRSALRWAGDPAFQTVYIGGSPQDGAVGDLASAPADLPPTQPFPIGYLAGSTNSASLQNLNSPLSLSFDIGTGCSWAGSGLALELTPTLWNNVFGGAANDAIVPVSSQLNGKGSTGANTFQGVIHSPGIEVLNFAPPSEVDPSSGIPDAVINLLNESTTGPDFCTGCGGSGGGPAS